MQPNFEIPVTVALFFLVLLLLAPVFSGIGIYHLIRKKFRASSFVLTSLVFGSILLYGLYEGISTDLLADTFGVLSFPFSLIAAALTESMYISIFIGLLLNFFAIFGAVTAIQRKLSAEPW